MLAQNIINLEGKIVGQIDLDEDTFGKPLCEDILHRVVNWQLAGRRAGTHYAKGISDISGTTKKPYNQKGTGRARQGSLRSPQFRGGAVVFGPVVRSHAYKLTKKFKKLALKIALSAKLAENQVLIMENVRIESNKTKDLVTKFNALNINLRSTLVIDGDYVDQNFKQACHNLYKLDVLPQIGANVYDILNHKNLILTVDAIKLLQMRLKND